MPMLGILAIVVGALVAVTRIVGVFSPETVRGIMRFFLEKRRLALVMMVIVAIVGSLFIWGFRLYAHDHAAIGWAAWVLLALGIVMVGAGIFGLIVPRIPFTMMGWLYITPSNTMRGLCAAGAVAGILVIVIAFFL